VSCNDGGSTEELEVVTGAVDVAGLVIDPGFMSPGAGGTLRIYISVEAWITDSQRTLLLGCEWRGIAA
jgi:hypothetical protein